jgi:hypothetical protein
MGLSFNKFRLYKYNSKIEPKQPALPFCNHFRCTNRADFENRQAVWAMTRHKLGPAAVAEITELPHHSHRFGQSDFSEIISFKSYIIDILSDFKSA